MSHTMHALREWREKLGQPGSEIGRRIAGIGRRRFLGATFAVGATVWTTSGAFAEQLSITPSQGEGPFYPDKLPLDTDNDLLIINDAITPAVGEITHLTGKLQSQAGVPIRNALIEIWQVDNHGTYIHSASQARNTLDTNFQGYGRFHTSSSGEYYFRTIKPVQYPGRPAHIHVAVSQHGRRILTTQMYVSGDPRLATDGLARQVTDRDAFKTLVVDFVPLPESKMGELTANFDIVLGVTPPDEPHTS